ncbi:MAG: twin-arginine translocation pathway signal protein [Geminicoccus sp.]|nr:twin-arginine translocation pathway signal protein [Geminicoccus sp.]
MDRRKVLSSLVAGLCLPLAPIQLAEAAARTGRRLILVELSGANDGLNTVAPWANDRYRAIRPSVALDRSDMITLDDQLGLNNALSSLESAWQAGEMAIIQGLGYPEQNRSHFKSIALWETGGDGNRAGRNGWLTEDVEAMGSGFDAHGISLDGGMGVFASSSGLWLSFTSLHHLQTLSAVNAGLGGTVSDSANPALSMLLERGNALDSAMGQISAKIHQKGLGRHVNIDGGDLGRQAALAATLINAGVDAPVLKVKIGGFDTHENQRGDHERLLRDLGRSLAGLRTALQLTGHWDQTLILTYSEFGRRATENYSRGTDHGTAAPHLLLGGGVRGGLFGRHPDLEDLDDGDLKYTLDYRAVYQRLLAGWFGLSDNRFSGFEDASLDGVLI